MPDVIEIPAGRRFGLEATIRPLFNVGIPGYFTLASEIPSVLFDQNVPVHDYRLVVSREVPRVYLRTRQLRPPTIAETLWVLGFMNMGLSAVVSRYAVRFIHEPFCLSMRTPTYPEFLRQIVAKRSGRGFALETVAVNSAVKDFHLAYVMA
jgi:hypothetical protein